MFGNCAGHLPHKPNHFVTSIAPEFRLGFIAKQLNRICGHCAGHWSFLASQTVGILTPRQTGTCCPVVPQPNTRREETQHFHDCACCASDQNSNMGSGLAPKEHCIKEVSGDTPVVPNYFGTAGLGRLGRPRCHVVVVVDLEFRLGFIGGNEQLRLNLICRKGFTHFSAAP